MKISLEFVIFEVIVNNPCIVSLTDFWYFFLLDSSDNGLSKATHPADFAILISVLKQRFPHNISLLTELTDYINNSAGHMVISTDSAYKNTQ